MRTNAKYVFSTVLALFLSVTTVSCTGEETKRKELKTTGVGSWLGQIVFDDKVYWSYFDEKKTEWSQEGLWLLPSDSFFREDLNSVVKGDIDLAQKEKERLEELQRSDQRLRDAYKAKHNN